MSDDDVDAEPLDGSCHRANKKAKIQRCPNCHAIELKRKGRNNYFRCPRCGHQELFHTDIRQDESIPAPEKCMDCDDVHLEWTPVYSGMKLDEAFADVVDNAGNKEDDT